MQTNPTHPIHRGPTHPIHRGPTHPIHRGPTQPIHRGPTHPIHRSPTHPIHRGIDRTELDRRIVEMYLDVANEMGRDLHFPTGRTLAAGLGYSAELLDRLPAEAVNSFAGVGYHFGLARLLPGDRVLDLGSGSGMDVFAAAVQVGPHSPTPATTSRASGHSDRAKSTARGSPRA
jgi:hypothetical protein